MDKKIYIVLILAVLCFCSCGKNMATQDVLTKAEKESISQSDNVKDNDTYAQIETESSEMKTKDESRNSGNIDVDLTALSSTMVYAEVYNMMVNPKDYVGKIIKTQGQFTVFTNQDQSQYYTAVVIADATACCQQGLEFVPDGGNMKIPDDYPKEGTEIIVTGRFETYTEGEEMFCHLVDTEMICQ